MRQYMNKFQIPLLETDPLHVVFKASVPLGALAAGFFDWTLGNATVTGNPRVDLDPANLYAIEYFTFSADIEENDFTSAIVDDSAPATGTPGIPRFHLYVDSEFGGPILTQPIPLPQYYQEASFPKWKRYTKESQDGGDSDSIAFQGMKSTNQFKGAFEGRLSNIGPLIGKASISLVFAFGLFQIKDEAFIREYRGHEEQRRGAYHG